MPPPGARKCRQTASKCARVCSRTHTNVILCARVRTTVIRVRAKLLFRNTIRARVVERTRLFGLFYYSPLFFARDRFASAVFRALPSFTTTLVLRLYAASQDAHARTISCSADQPRAVYMPTRREDGREGKRKKPAPKRLVRFVRRGERFRRHDLTRVVVSLDVRLA